MASLHSMKEFWTSLLEKDRRSGAAFEDMTNFEDPLEQSVRIALRTIFVLFMGVKIERDDVIGKLSKIPEKYKCQNCDKSHIIGAKEESESTEVIDSSDERDKDSGKMRKIFAEFDEMLSASSHSINDIVPLVPYLGSGSTADSQTVTLSKVEDPLRSSGSPGRKDGHRKVDANGNDRMIKVLAPETVSLDEHILHVNIEKRKALATQTVFVPETLAINTQGDKDFFDTESTLMEEDSSCNARISDCGLKSQYSPVLGKQNILSTENSKVNSYSDVNSEFCHSPILGKQIEIPEPSPKDVHTPTSNKQNERTPVKRKTPKIIRFPSFDDFKSPVKDMSVQGSVVGEVEPLHMKNDIRMGTENLLDNDIQPKDASTPRYIPLQINSGLSPIGEDSFTSPSLLPSAKIKNDDLGKKNLLSLSRTEIPPRTPPGSKRSLRRSTSTVESGTNKKGSVSMKRYQTEDKASKCKQYEIELEPPGKKVKYKQAKISDLALNKTEGRKLTGSVSRMTFDEELDAALKASLKDLEKGNQKQVMESCPSSTSKDESGDADEMGGRKRCYNASSSSVNLAKDKGTSKSNSSIRRSPRKSDKLDESCSKISPTKNRRKRCVSSPKMSPIKRQKRVSESSPEKSPFKSPKKHSKRSPPKNNLRHTESVLRRSPRKDSQERADSNLRKSPKKNVTEKSKKNEDMFDLEEILDRVNKSGSKTPDDRSSTRISLEKTFTNSSSESSKKDTTKNLLKKGAKLGRAASENNISSKKFVKKMSLQLPQIDDSFDMVPKEDEDEPAYRYRGDVVRKRDERRKLEGWGCPECEAYYDGADPELKKAAMNKCSLHRSKYNPVTNTPKNFWNPAWVETLDSEDLE